MATYKLKKMVDGTWRIWARYRPFKGAAAQSHITYASRAELLAAVEASANWVAERRKQGTSRQDRASKPTVGENS